MTSLSRLERICVLALVLVAWAVRWTALMEVPAGWRDDDLIELYTFRVELILDPFCGEGATCVAERKLGRRFTGYDTHLEYLEIARKRISEAPAGVSPEHPIGKER